MYWYRRKIIVTLLSVLFLGSAQAQEFPTKAVRFIVPYPPGGLNDTSGRIIAEGLTQYWKQPVIVENRPGASGMIGMGETLTAKPDGYTIFVGSNSEFTITPFTKKVEFSLDDFNPIGKVATTGMVFAAPINAPFNTVSELVEYAKKQSAPLQYGTPGAGTINQILAERFAYELGLKFQHVPYRGGSQTLAAAVSGEVPLIVLSVGLTVPQANDGRLKLLAISSADRNPSAPKLPTLKELNVPIAMTTWLGLFTAKKVPDAVNERIYAGLKYVLDQPGTKAKFAAQALDIPPLASRPGFLDEIRAQAVENKAVIESAHIVAE